MSVPKGEKINALAHNLRFLRKKMGISQDEMARRLGIKRSNIAAYEIKNVEPRLRVIMEFSSFFNIDIKNLIQTPLDDLSFNKLHNKKLQAESEKPIEIFEIDDDKEVKDFVEKSQKIRKIFDGFKAFYSLKKEKMVETDPQIQKLLFDIENFLQLIEHLLTYNETLIKALTGSDNN